MNTFTLKRNLKKSLIIAILVIIVIIGIIFIVKNNPTTTQQTQEPQATYEITETDIFSLPSFNAADITIKGIRIGSTMDEVTEKLGSPDIQTLVKDNILNLEYGKSMNLSDTGLIIQMKDGKVNQLTFKQPFNPYLIGSTQIKHGKEEIYLSILGKPDNIFFIPMTANSALAYKILEYKERGLYILLRKDEQNGFALRTTALESV